MLPRRTEISNFCIKSDIRLWFFLNFYIVTILYDWILYNVPAKTGNRFFSLPEMAPRPNQSISPDVCGDVPSAMTKNCEGWRLLVKYPSYYLSAAVWQNTQLYYIYYPSVFHWRILQVGDRWQVTKSTWHMTHDTGHVEHDTWPLTDFVFKCLTY